MRQMRKELRRLEKEEQKAALALARGQAERKILNQESHADEEDDLVPAVALSVPSADPCGFIHAKQWKKRKMTREELKQKIAKMVTNLDKHLSMLIRNNRKSVIDRAIALL